MHSRRHSSKLKRSLTSAKKRVAKLRRSLKKSGSKSKRTRSLRKSLKKAKKSLKSAQKKSSSKKGSKKASKRRTRENIAEFKCNVKKAKSNTKEALIKEIRSYVNCVEKKTGRNQDMSLARLREEPVSQLKQFLSFYRKEY